MINFWKMTVEAVKKQRDQYKAERDKLKDDVLAWAVTCNNLEQENEKLKEEVDHLKGIIQDEEDWKLLESEEKWE